MTGDTLTMDDVVRGALRCARDAWSRPVYDAPQDHDWLAQLHREAGMGWTLEGDEYDPKTDFWCGAFVAYCYANAGDFVYDDRCVDVGFDTDMAGQLFASTTRLMGRHSLRWLDYGYDAPQIVDPFDVRPGDIPIVRTNRTERVWGDHVTLARGGLDAEDLTIPTWEGNAYGTRGDQTKGQGVIRDFVSMKDVAAILRPDPEWFDSLTRNTEV